MTVVIGPSSSSAVKATHPISGGMHVPQFGPVATDPTLSVVREEYPFLLKVSNVLPWFPFHLCLLVSL